MPLVKRGALGFHPGMRPAGGREIRQAVGSGAATGREGKAAKPLWVTVRHAGCYRPSTLPAMAGYSDQNGY